MEKTERLITPPHELICQWQSESPFKVISVEREDYMINRAARWAADQELDACCDWLEKGPYGFSIAGSAPELTSILRTNRRPKPPTLKQKARESLKRIQQFQATYQDIEVISSAIQALPDEGGESD
jgi:hypothetical protein